MASFKEELADLLREHLADLEDHLEELPSDRVGGTVVSSDFDDLDHQQRRERLRKIVEKLSADKALRVGPITLLTPAEWSVEIPSDS